MGGIKKPASFRRGEGDTGKRGVRKLAQSLKQDGSAAREVAQEHLAELEAIAAHALEDAKAARLEAQALAGRPRQTARIAEALSRARKREDVKNAIFRATLKEIAELRSAGAATPEGPSLAEILMRPRPPRVKTPEQIAYEQTQETKPQ